MSTGSGTFYFGGGAGTNFPAGNYVVFYVGGAWQLDVGTGGDTPIWVVNYGNWIYQGNDYHYGNPCFTLNWGGGSAVWPFRVITTGDFDNGMTLASQAEAEYEQICPEGPGFSVAFTHTGGPIKFIYDITVEYVGFVPGNGNPNPTFILFRVS
jgi:hypothetical protein